MRTERPPSATASWLLVFRFAILVLAFAFGCLLIQGPTSVRFFEVAAQVLPVLLLAFALEFRFLTPGSGPGTGDLLDVGLLFLVLAFGEWIALDAVATGVGTENEGTVVAASLLTGFLGVGIGAVTANATPPPRPAWAASAFKRRLDRAATPERDDAARE